MKYQSREKLETCFKEIHESTLSQTILDLFTFLEMENNTPWAKHHYDSVITCPKC